MFVIDHIYIYVCYRPYIYMIFSVKLLFKALVRSDDIVFPHTIIWNSRVPTKVGFFAWKASWGKLLTLDLMKKREGL